MRRKLINYEAFERIQRDSLSAAERELYEAQDILAAALGVDRLSLDCFGDSHVVYETLDGTFIRADFDLQNEHLVLENIEELVIDDESADRKGKESISDMIEALLGKDESKAAECFSEYMKLPSVRRTIAEGRQPGFFRPRAEAKAAGKTKAKNAKEKSSLFKSRKRKLDSVSDPSDRPRSKRNSLNFGKADDPNYQKRYHRARKAKHIPRKVIDAKGNVKIRRSMKEWAVLSENVMGYVSYVENGPILKESHVQTDDKGNVVAVRIPSARLRNESRLINLNYKTLSTECKTMRENALGLSQDKEFCKLVASLKRHNNMSDNAALEESLENIIGRYPNVLFLTQDELASEISEALGVAGVTNYDDQICTFLGEAILRTAHGVFSDRAEKIMRLAQAELTEEVDDPYEAFQAVVSQFYPTLDENFGLESRVFADLLEAVSEVHAIGSKAGDRELAELAAEYMEELQAIVDGSDVGDLGFAEEVAEWLNDLVETNLTMGDWEVSNNPHLTVNGDHPAMAEKARKGYSPASDFSGEWGDPAPMIGQDNMSYKGGEARRARTSSWGNAGGEGTFPSLNNPYVPKPFGDYTMKGEKGADKDWSAGLGTENGSDTWPTLQNPYIPKGAETPKSFKMKDGSETDLVVDK